MNRWKPILLVLVLALIVAGCGGTQDSQDEDTSLEGSDQSTAAGDESDGEASGVAQRDMRIVVVTHGEPGSSFWAVVQNGVEAAQRDMGVTVEYQNPDTFDLVRMAQLIEGAISSQPDGLVVSIPDADAIGPTIKQAVEAGIPVVSMNSGGEVWEELGALTHIGSDEFVAGTAAGERLGEMGVKNVICINDEVGNAAPEIRCDSAAEALEAAGGTMKVLPAPTGDPIGIQAAVAAALQADPSIDGGLSMSPDAAIPALKAIQEADLDDQVRLATFDLGADVLKAVQNGDIEFAVDQQQFLQGYLPVVFLTLYAENLLMPGGGQPVLTGPSFVTAETAEDVLSLSEAGIR
jgi:simple sugar transport system substrate-binding protein